VYILEASVEAAEEVPLHLRKYISWARNFVDQLIKFGPNGTAHDDYVDTFTQACLYLRDAGWLDLPEVEEDEPEPSAYGAKPRNPYD
jgi:phage terminase large subunit-like protein